MTNPITIAQERFAKGFSCSQAVFSAYSAQLGIEDETALKLASPFGGGVARQGQVCGAVTGALMVLGLNNGSADLEDREKNYESAEEFIKRFEELHGTIVCRELISHDISQPDELQRARENDVFNNVCPGLVKDAAELASEFIK